MGVGISAFGTAVPAYSYSQKEIVEFLSQTLDLKPSEKRRIAAIYQATGIENRYSVLDDHQKRPGEYQFFPNQKTDPFPTTKQRMNLYKTNAPMLAFQAISDCISNSPQENDVSILKSITHVITVSCTGMYAPGLDIEIIQHFNMSTTIHRTAINFMGCYGAFNALKTAYSICRANPNAKVLLVCLELCSLHFQKPEILDKIISSAIFSDGAAAVIVKTQTDNSKYLKIEDFYCDVMPQSNNEMAWNIADNGFDIVLSSYVPTLIEKGIAAFFDKFLNSKFLHLHEIDYFAIHPGGIKILQACEKALNITKDQNHYSYEILRNYGNMSSVTILFVLKKIWETLKDSKTSEKILSCAFGPGLTLESMLMSHETSKGISQC